jgi:hypothetical protein
MASLIYNSFRTDLASGNIDLNSDTLKLMLVTSAYTPDASADSKRSHVTNEVSGTGYSSGGAALSGATVTQSGATAYLDAADVSWPASTITARGAVLYKSTGSATDDNLIAYIDFGSDRSSSSGTFGVNWNASGIIVLE